MKASMKFKAAVVGLVAAGALVLSGNAQAVTLDAGVFGPNLGDPGTETNPIIMLVPVPNATSLPDGFLDTIDFDLGTWTHFNMTSQSTNIGIPSQFGTIGPFEASIFSNFSDGEVVGASPTHLSVFLPDLNLARDYHLHPTGQVLPGGGSYQLAMWGSTAPVPLPAAAWLFGSGVIGLVGLARRKMRARA